MTGRALPQRARAGARPLRAGALALAIALFGVCIAPLRAGAHAPSTTISGTATNAGNTPGSNTIDASLEATLEDASATGTVRSEGREGSALEGTWKRFEGEVTCMLV